MVEWRSSTWGDEITLEYGKGIRDYSSVKAGYQVFGSNGAIGWTSKPLAPGPGVILGRKGAYRGVRFSPDPFFVIDTAYYVVPKTDLDMRWLYYAIVYHRLGEIDDGSPIPSTTRAAVYVRNVRIPSIEEQRAIASTLGALDDKIELNHRMNQTLEAMARAIFLHCSLDWPETTLGELAYIYDGPHATPTKTDHGPIFLGISNLSNGQLDLSDVERLSEEDFVRWTRRVTPMSGEGLRCCLGRRMGLLRSKPDKVHSELLLHAYVSNYFQETIRQRTVHGSTVERLLLTEMGSFPIRMTTVDQQTETLFLLRPLWLRIDHNQGEARTLSDLRDLLLPKLMSGEIRVRDAEKMVEAAA